MSIQFSFAHSLGLDEARRRLFEQAKQQEIEVSLDPADPNRGEVVAQSPVGKVRARFVLGEREIEVEVVSKPTFVPASMVKSKLEEGLRDLLG